jgi:hypothetical protein
MSAGGAPTTEEREEEDFYKTRRSIKAATWVEERGKPIHQIIPRRIQEITDKYQPKK